MAEVQRRPPAAWHASVPVDLLQPVLDGWRQMTGSDGNPRLMLSPTETDALAGILAETQPGLSVALEAIDRLAQWRANGNEHKPVPTRYLRDRIIDIQRERSTAPQRGSRRGRGPVETVASDDEYRRVADRFDGTWASFLGEKETR